MKNSALLSFTEQARRFSIAICLLACLPTHAATYAYDCPAYVSPSSLRADEILPPWKIYNQPSKLKVVSTGLSDGEPSDMGFLKPYEIKRKGNSSSIRWKLEGEYPKGVWLSCTYQGDFLSLARELPSGINECVVEYEKTKSTKINSIVCK